MNRELFLLSSYQVPTKHRLMLDADDVAAFLNGYLALWHPTLLAQASGPPRTASPYDHEQPKTGAVYAVPENPPSFLPEDWRFRLKEAQAVSFVADSDRDATLVNLAEVIEQEPAQGQALAGGLSAVGLGFLVLQALAEAMDHANPVSEAEFWQHVQEALCAETKEKSTEALQAAVEQMRLAREVLYSSHLYQLDFATLRPGQPLPLAVEMGMPVNLLATGQTLRILAETEPQKLDTLKRGVEEQRIEIIAGPWEEETEALWPIERQFSSIKQSLAEHVRIFGRKPATFGRQRFAATAHLPAMLHSCGSRQLLMFPGDSSVLPSYKGAFVEWTLPDNKTVAALVRKPEPTHEAGLYFHLAHLLHESILQDFTACMLFGSFEKPAATWHRDWLELHRLGPVFGQFATVSQFLGEVSPSEYLPTISADEFQSDYLVDLHDQKDGQPVSRFVTAQREERNTRAKETLAGLEKAIAKNTGATEQPVAVRLTERILAHGAKPTPGFLLFNTCNFTRCLTVELPAVQTPMPAPARASQIEREGAKAVVEVPPFGFAWLPRVIAPGTKVPTPKRKIIDGLTLQNEFLEAEIDEKSGGVRAVRDAVRRIGRLGQQLVFQPGSSMQADEVKMISSGPVLGEISTSGKLVDSQNETLATFRQRFRLWWARPFLEIRIELQPTQTPQGYPWHAYYGCRFAWRDSLAQLKRTVGWQTHATALTRPETADVLEIHSAGQRTAILTGGLSFHQRYGPRMLDVVLLPEGETGRTFDVAVALDVEEPLAAALDWTTPPVVVPVDRGPPAVGPSGWLCDVDASNLIVTSFRPASDGKDAVVLRLCECRGMETEAVVRFVRDPVRACLVDEFGEALQERELQGDAVLLQFAPLEMVLLRVEFSPTPDLLASV